MLKLFATSEYDKTILLRHNGKDYTVKTVKEIVSAKIKMIKDLSNNVVILTDDNFIFIINLLAAIYAKKTIYLITEPQKLQTLNIEYSIINNEITRNENDYDFKEINPKEVFINFFTSGSTNEPKCITKNLWNLIEEGKDVAEELKLKGKRFIIKTTTSMGHLFGMTFALMLPINNGNIIDTDRIFYAENVDLKECIFVATPAFLSAMKKHQLKFTTNPECIISAGEKLPNEVFQYFEKDSFVVEIYGSTETGVIAYRRSSNNNELKIFPNVTIIDNSTIKSNYIFEKHITINDNIETKGEMLILKGRKDRLVKIYDKRVSLEAIETSLDKIKYIHKSYCFKHNDKLVSLIALSDIGKNYIITNGIIALEKELKKELKAFYEIVPQRWKFSDEIPHNTVGKIDKEYIRKIFNVNFSYPIILDHFMSNDKIRYKLFFYRNCNFYKGHFPEFPITPGVAQLYLANELINYNYKGNYSAGQIKRIKFTNIIYPDSIVYLELNKTDKYIEFVYLDDSKVYSSGAFPLNNIFLKEI